jgi:hypothetical protein
LLLTTFAALMGVQFLALGMLGELGTRTYFEVRQSPPYAIRRTVNCSVPEDAIPYQSHERRAA